MTKADRSKPVLVTGATGYIASWLVKILLEEGLTVHAAVRNPSDKEKIGYLNKLRARFPGKIKYFKSDLLHPGSYEKAMKGCEVVFHTASPFILTVNDPQKELIDPAVKGTQNVLFQANKLSSVKRVVLTSSCAAIYADVCDCSKAPNGTLTEDFWNTSSSLKYLPYSFSKTLAEKEAWKINGQQSRWDLVVINPSLVLGPALNPKSTQSESLNLLKQLGNGTLKRGVPPIGIGIVDVRDVAIAHYRAGFSKKANGRFITNGHNSSFLEIAKIVSEKYGENYPVPKKEIPGWLLMLIGPFVNKALNRKYLKNNLNIPWKADNSKSINILGITYRTLEETMDESFRVLIDNDMI